MERTLAAASHNASAQLKQEFLRGSDRVDRPRLDRHRDIRDTSQGDEQSLTLLLTIDDGRHPHDRAGCRTFDRQVSSAAIEAVRTSAVDAERTLNGASSGVAAAMKQNAGELERSLTQLAAATGEALRSSADDATRKITTASGEVSGAIKRGTGEAERALTTVATGVTAALEQNAGEVERTLLGVSAEIARGITAKAEELTANINQRGTDLRRVLDEKTGVFLSTFGAQGQKFSTEIERLRKAVQSIDKKASPSARRWCRPARTSPCRSTRELQGERPDRPDRRRARLLRARRDRAFPEGRLGRRDRDDGNARHAAKRHVRAVRAAARGQCAAAGGARRRNARISARSRRRCRAVSPSSSPR